MTRPLLGLTLAIAGVAGIGLYGDALLYFYIAYGIAAFGTLLLLLEASRSKSDEISLTPAAAVAAIVAVALGVRAFLFFHGPQLSFDLHWYADYVQFIRMHATPYTNAFYFPYPQGFLDFLLPFATAANAAVAIHWALIGVDCIVAAGIFAVLRRFSNNATAFWGAMAYAVAPMPAIEAGRIGHFETLVSLCFIALLLALQSRRAFASAVAVVVGASLKVYPAIAAPAVLYTWRRKRDVLLSLVGAVVACSLTFAPLLRLVSFDRLASFWIGASASSPSSGTGFVANSIPAMVADMPAAIAVLWAAKAVLVILVLALVVYAVGAGREIGADIVERIPSFGIAAMLALFVIYGVYLIAKPWTASQYAYTWWTPTPLSIGWGVALSGLAGIGLYALMRSKVLLSPVQGIGVLIAAALVFLVLQHGNVNPWYLMPCVALLLCAVPARPAMFALGCLMTYYACFNTSGFSQLGWNDVIVSPAQWHAKVTPGTKVGIKANSLTITASGSKGRASATVSSQTFAYAQPNTALAFDVLGDTDPTFHRKPFELNVFVTGNKAVGSPVGRVPLVLRDSDATSIGPIRYRVPLFQLPDGLNTISRVDVVADTMGRPVTHTLQVRNVALVNESRWDIWTAQATAIVTICIALLLWGLGTEINKPEAIPPQA